MRFLTEIVDALAGFVQRNPLTVLLVVVLAVGAPALLKGIALFILYFFMGLLLLVVAGLLFFRWRVCKMRREMEERFGREFGPERPGGFRQGFGGGAPRTPREGEVRAAEPPEPPRNGWRRTWATTSISRRQKKTGERC